MAIHPLCDYCGRELEDFGALLFSQPTQNTAIKYHIFKECYRAITEKFVQK